MHCIGRLLLAAYWRTCYRHIAGQHRIDSEVSPRVYGGEKPWGDCDRDVERFALCVLCMIGRRRVCCGSGGDGSRPSACTNSDGANVTIFYILYRTQRKITRCTKFKFSTFRNSFRCYFFKNSTHFPTTGKTVRLNFGRCLNFGRPFCTRNLV